MLLLAKVPQTGQFEPLRQPRQSSAAVRGVGTKGLTNSRTEEQTVMFFCLGSGCLFLLSHAGIYDGLKICATLLDTSLCRDLCRPPLLSRGKLRCLSGGWRLGGYVTAPAPSVASLFTWY